MAGYQRGSTGNSDRELRRRRVNSRIFPVTRTSDWRRTHHPVDVFTVSILHDVVPTVGSMSIVTKQPISAIVPSAVVVCEYE